MVEQEIVVERLGDYRSADLSAKVGRRKVNVDVGEHPAYKVIVSVSGFLLPSHLSINDLTSAVCAASSKFVCGLVSMCAGRINANSLKFFIVSAALRMPPLPWPFIQLVTCLCQFSFLNK